jgi:hypothetical protein
LNDSLFLPNVNQQKLQQRNPSNVSANQANNMFRTDSPQFENQSQFENLNKKNQFNTKQSKNNSNEQFGDYNSNDSNLYESNNIQNKKSNYHRNISPTPKSMLNEPAEDKNEYENKNNWSKTSKTSEFEINNFDNETSNFQNDFIVPKKSARRRWQEAFAIIRRQISVSTCFLSYSFFNF